MSDQLFDMAVRDWLEDGSDRTPPPAIDAVLLAVKTTPQERDLRIPWRFHLMPTYLRLAAGIAIVAVVGVGALLLSNKSPNVGPPSPSASPSPGLTASMQIGVDAPGTILYGVPTGGGGQISLRAVSANGSDDRELVPDNACCLVTSPDAGWLLYGADSGGRLVPTILAADRSASETWTWTGSDGNGAIDSTTLNLGPAAATLLDSGWDFAFEGWDDRDASRTGVYLDTDNGGGQVRGVLTRVTTSPAGYHDVPLSFAPDGTRILFVRGKDNGQFVGGDLYVVARDGSGLVRLSPDGSQVTISDEFGGGASWSADGTQVTFASPERVGSATEAIFVVASSGGPATAITAAGPSTTSARWSPDGSWIAFDRGTPAGPHDVFIVHPDGTGLTNLTSSFATGVCCSQWSPDGRWLVVQGSPVNDDNKTDLFMVSTQGAPPARLTQSPSGYRLWVQWTSPLP